MDHRLLDDRYRLVDHVGSGESSSVWSAVDVRLGRTVALKLFAPQATRRLRTADALAATASSWTPGLTRVYDAVVDLDVGDSGRTAVIRELATGSALDVWAARRVSSSVLATIGASVATTLAGLHHVGAAHGSVRASNIIVGRAGEVRLTDFGVRQMLSGAPSQRPGDVRGLGWALLGALTGRHVIGSRTARLALQHLRSESGLRGRHSRAWTDVLHAMASDDVAQRPTAAGAAQSLASLADETSGRSTARRRRPIEEMGKPPWDVIFSV